MGFSQASLDATGLPAAFPSTAKVRILVSHLRRRRCVEWAWFNTHPAVSRSYRHPRTFRCNRTRGGGGTCRNKIRRLIHQCWSRLGHNFLFFLILYPLRHFGAAYQAEILDAASGAEMADIEQMKKIVPLITCEIPFSQHVCELIFGVNVTDLRATLWDRETCVIVGLRPLIIILTTASLSSKTHNIAPEPECVVFDGKWSMLVGITLVCLIGMGLCMFGLTTAEGFHSSSLLGPSVLFGAEWSTSITKSQRVRAGIPSIRKPASREMISASVKLCETEACFLHIQRIGTNVWLPKKHKTPPDVDFESSQSPAKSESWNNPNLHCCAVFPTPQYCRKSFVRWMYEIKRDNRLSQAFVHFVTTRASLFSDHKKTGLPTRARYRYLKTFFFFKLMAIHAWRCDVVLLLSRFLCKFAMSYHTFLCVTFHVIELWWYRFGIRVPPTLLFLAIFLYPWHKSLIRTYPCSLSQCHSLLYSLFECNPKKTWSKNDVGSHKSTSFMRIFQVGLMYCFPQPVWYRPHTQIRTVLFLG